jgi:hypothetical protein
VLARAGWLAASLWIVGIGARMGFTYSAAHGAGPAIATFSAVHDITSAAAWVAAFVLMGLAEVTARLVVLRLRARAVPVASISVAATAPAYRQVQAGLAAGAGRPSSTCRSACVQPGWPAAGVVDRKLTARRTGHMLVGAL